MKLRNYQSELIVDVKKALRLYRRVLIQLETGGGKTAIAAFMALSAVAKGNTIVFTCHRSELIIQTALTFGRLGLKYGFIAAGYPYDPTAPIQIASIDTLKNRMNKIPEPSIVVWDEAHHLGAAGWTRVQATWKNSYHIGLSATPERLDGRGLEDNFDFMIKGKDAKWLIGNGYLSEYDAFTPTSPDVSGIKTIAGDYQKSGLVEEMEKPSITGDIVKHYLKHARGKRAIGFAVTIDHSEHMAETFRKSGIMAIHLDGNSKSGDRKAAAKAFAAGDIDVLWNVGLFGEGYDLSAQAGTDVTVDAVILARPTKSICLHRQMIGRALRPKTDKSNAIILDHAGNIMRFGRRGGLPELSPDWTLKGREKGKRRPVDDEADQAIKRCPACLAAHLPKPVCPFCGHVYESGRTIEERDGDLNRIDAASLMGETFAEDYRERSLEELYTAATEAEKTNPAQWAARIVTIREQNRRTQAGKKKAGN